MNDVAFLRVVVGKTIVNGGIPSSFVTICPNKDARVVYITKHHFGQQLFCYFSAIAILPTTQFIEIKKPYGVAYF